MKVPFVDTDVCLKSYPDRITDRMFCAGDLKGGVGSCNGDSGGPVVMNGIQYGLVSWSFGCGEPDYPGVFAKVSSVREWIKEVAGV